MFVTVRLYLFIQNISMSVAHIIKKIKKIKKKFLCPVISQHLCLENQLCQLPWYPLWERQISPARGTNSSFLYRTPNRHQKKHTAVWQAVACIIKGNCLPVPWPTVCFGQATHFIHLWIQRCFLKAKTLFLAGCYKRRTPSLCRILQFF